MKFIGLLAVVLIQTTLVLSNILPNKFPQFCSKSTPNYDQCKETFFERAKPFLLKGIPRLNVPRLNPLEIVSLEVSNRVTDQISFAGIFQNIQVSGFQELQLTDYDFDHKTLEGKFSVTVPSIKVKLDYNITAQVFGNQVKNVGSAKSHAINASATYTIAVRKVSKSGTEYFDVEKLEFHGRVGDVDLHIETNDPTYQSTIDQALNFYNQDHQRAIKIAKPVIEDTVLAFSRSIFDAALSTVPAKELFPEI